MRSRRRSRAAKFAPTILTRPASPILRQSSASWGRPAWYVRNDAPEVGNENDLSRDEEFWIVQIGNAGKELRRICARVGVVTIVNDGQPIPFGTAWVVGERTVITNAHVGKQLAHQPPGIAAGDPRQGWRMRPGVKGVIDFASKMVSSAQPRSMWRICSTWKRRKCPTSRCFDSARTAPPSLRRS